MMISREKKREKERVFDFMPTKLGGGHIVATFEGGILLHLRGQSKVLSVI